MPADDTRRSPEAERRRAGVWIAHSLFYDHHRDEVQQDSARWPQLFYDHHREEARQKRRRERSRAHQGSPLDSGSV